MDYRRNILKIFTVCVITASMTVVSACAGGTSSPTATPGATSPSVGGGGGAVINSDSIITGQIKAIRAQASGYPWEVDVLVQTSEDVGSLPNPTKDKIGQVITAKTDQDMTLFSAGQSVTARVKYVGDVPRPGISLYIYDIQLKQGY